MADDVVAAIPLGGGDVAESFRIDTAGGATFFAKTHRQPPPQFFTTEAASLQWLRDANVIPVPEVVAVSDEPAMLVLEWIDEDLRRGNDATFGGQLAALHRAGAEAFGRNDRRPTTSRSLANDPCRDWVEFFATRRLEPLARLARDAGALPDSTIDKVDRVANRLPELVGAPEPPARLHGDLWAGNRLVDSSGVSWLIDPSSFGGHREFDLAMMRLFGGFGDDCFAAYHDACPIADGWPQRVPLYQLAPLITHAIKFGGNYADATERAADAVLGQV